MQGGFKQVKLGAEFQRELEKFKREAENIQQRIDEKKREKARVEYQIKSEKEIILKTNTQKKQRLAVLEKIIRGTENEFKSANERNLNKAKNFSAKIAELNNEIKAFKDERGRSKEKRLEEGREKVKTTDDLMREKNDLQTKIKELQSKLKAIDLEIQKSSQKTSSQKIQTGAMNLDQQIKLKESEREKLEREKNRIHATVSASSDGSSRKKLKAMQEKEEIENWLKSQVISLNLQRFESNIEEINRSILQLERQKIEAERSLSSTRSRLRR